MAYFRGIFGFTAQPGLLVTMGVSVPHVIDGFQGFLCLWFYRPGYTKADSFCSGKRRPLRGVLEYIAWHGWSRVPYMLTDTQKEVLPTGLVCFLWKTIDQAIQIVTLPQNSFSRWTLLCGSWEDKTCFTAIKQLGHQYPLFSNMCYSFKEQRIGYFNA